MIDETLSHYRILEKLGKGGMGEVYRARDTRLDRDVAVKVLPPEMSDDPERIARFQREARTLASLQHSNIASIYGFENTADAQFLVMELVEGEDLAQRLERGALPIDEAIEIAAQIATGLEAAHEQSIVHRDLKPANVKLGTAEEVKILDFGLARAYAETVQDEGDLSTSPTITAALTQVGTILGTAAYMSPEQARGKSVDKRTDIWSFGCVLYEIISGRRAYDGDTVSDVVARILEREPDWSALPSSTPPQLVALLKRCLAKDPKQRMRDIGDVRLALEAIAGSDTGGAVAGTLGETSARRIPTWALALVAIAIGVLGVVAGVRFVPRETGHEPATLSLLAPPGVNFGEDQSVIISPDGRQLAFVADDATSGTRIWLRDLSRDNARPLAHTEDAKYPFWSPDGRRLGFFADKSLKTVDLGTGAVRTLDNTPAPGGGSWGRGVILYQPSSLGPLWSVPEKGGEPTVATVVDSTSGEIGHRFPQFLPDGRHYIASIVTKNHVAAGVGEIGSPRLSTLFKTNWRGAVFTVGDWLVAPRDGLKAQRFDPRTLRLTGPEIDIQALHLHQWGTLGQPIFSASATGIVVQRVPPDVSQRLSLVDRQGRVIRDFASPVGEYSRPNISPDGRRAVVGHIPRGDWRSDLWVVDLARGTIQPWTRSLPQSENNNLMGVFSPDGGKIALMRITGDTHWELHAMRSDVPDSERLIHTWEVGYFGGRVLGWSPDGRGVLLAQGFYTRQDLSYVSLGDPVHVRAVQSTIFDEPFGSISPNGEWLAYVSDESGSYECRVRSFTDSDGPVQVVSRGACAVAGTLIGMPVWRRDGRELLYVAADERTLMTVSITTGDPPVFGEPQALFQLPKAIADIGVGPNLDEFLLCIEEEEEERSAATVLLNFPTLVEGER